MHATIVTVILLSGCTGAAPCDENGCAQACADSGRCTTRPRTAALKLASRLFHSPLQDPRFFCRPYDYRRQLDYPWHAQICPRCQTVFVRSSESPEESQWLDDEEGAAFSHPDMTAMPPWSNVTDAQSKRVVRRRRTVRK